VEDGVTGLLVDPGQPEPMAEAMAKLLVDRSLRDSIIEAARQRVRENFDNRKLINKLAAVFEEAGLERA
jgi:glycosyltransferase involved in cell wall biosynthesis